jgi:mono/diheme cytochrome c family protein
MRRHGSAFLPMLLSGAITCGVLYPATTVQAKAHAEPDALVHRVFSAASLPANGAFGLQAPADSLPEGKGKALALTNCTACHAANTWTTQHHTRDQWNTILDTMVSRGLTVSDADLDTIGGYLSANFGPAQKDPPASAPTAPPTPPPALPLP